jgi:hypothetical protein
LGEEATVSSIILAFSDLWSRFQTRTHSPLYEVNWHRPKSFGYNDPTSDRSVSQDFQKVFVPARFDFGPATFLREAHPVSGTVLSDIAKSRADIEGARLLVLSAALQIDKHQARGALKEIGIAKVCELQRRTVQGELMEVH